MSPEPNRTVLSLVLLVADLAPCGPAAPAWVLATALPSERFRVTIVGLNPTLGAAADDLAARGIEVRTVPVRHLLDFSGLRKLRHCLADLAPNVVHVWGSFAAALAPMVIARNGGGPRLVVSAAGGGSGLRGWLTARQVRRADRVVAATRVEGDLYRQAGVSPDQLTLIAPAVAEPQVVQNPSAVFSPLGVSATSLLLVGGGSSNRGIGPKDAVIAFDMLRYENPTLRLVLFGTGPETAGLEEFGRALAFDDFRIHFSACEPNRGAAVPLAFAVLVTQPAGGVAEALEAMSAGRPVIGWRTPELLDIVDDGTTGFLVPTGDRPALAAKVQILLDDRALAERMGAAGQTRARERFGVSRVVGQYERLYKELRG